MWKSGWTPVGYRLYHLDTGRIRAYTICNRGSIYAMVMPDQTATEYPTEERT
jgi:hypothetical protein